MVKGIADTHAVIWYVTPDERLSERAKTFIDIATSQGVQIGISAITLVEIVYLIEKGKIPAESLTKLVRVLNDPLGAFIEIPLNLSIARTLSQVSSSQVPDMPDRIIAATALHYHVPLISRDAKIQASSVQTIW
ncbi:MAG: type II toxin-antitoxin system VapC family toxin [Anaerolineae bacterium]|nr:type II toxin-antitoxin system VapC family toxin [Anaerolineae bacterium]